MGLALSVIGDLLYSSSMLCVITWAIGPQIKRASQLGTVN